MKRERIEKKVRPREQPLEPAPLSTREVFFPYPIRREPRSHQSR
jgi:hypothetical protein